MLTDAFERRGRALALTLLFATISVLLATADVFALTAPQISSNYKQSCVLIDTGAVKCFGLDASGQLGNGPADASGASPVDVVGITDAVQITTGEETVCARLAAGTVSCWGQDNSQQLGNGPGITSADVPMPVPGLANVAQITGGDGTFCALLVDTSVSCWGVNGDLQAGVIGGADVASPTPVAGLTGVQSLAAGGGTSCALMSGGTVKCWGDDDQGGLGNGPGPVDSATPVDVPGLTGVQQLAAGYDAVCALMSGGTVKCWGRGGEGQLGIGLFEARDTPTDVSGLTGAQRLFTGYEAFCAVMPGGALKCWGYNYYHQMGIAGDSANKATPTDVQGTAGATIFPDVFDESMCVGFPGGSVKCWGRDDDGQAGIAPLSESIETPTDVPGLDLVTQAHPALTPALASPSKAKVDRRKRFYTVSGTLGAGLSSWVAPGEACTGTATVSVTYSYKIKRRGKLVKRKKTVKKTVTLTVNPAGGCTASFSLKLPVKYLNRKTITIKASFAGNGAMQSFETSVKKKLPKVKIKKKK